jgi:hypothetical protein
MASTESGLMYIYNTNNTGHLYTLIKPKEDDNFTDTSSYEDSDDDDTNVDNEDGTNNDYYEDDGYNDYYDEYDQDHYEFANTYFYPDDKSVDCVQSSSCEGDNYLDYCIDDTHDY